MGRLTPAERAAINKRLKEIKAGIAKPVLTIEQVEQLRTERAGLLTLIMNDRNGV